MPNIIDYAKSNQKTMIEKNLNDVDSLILSELSYLPYDHIKEGSSLNILDSKEYLEEIKNESNENINLVKAVAKSNRFKEIKLLNYTKETNEVLEKQFAAVTFLLPTGEIYISYRGTDGTLIGWKEDFNMAYMYPVPAQDAALSYLEEIAKKYNRKIFVGGHSKGGNLAVYASCLATEEVKQRIIYVFSHDGPGFEKGFLKDCYFKTIKTKLRKTVPESSLIGMLLYSQGHYKIVKSDRFFIMEHDPFSWQIEQDHFIEVDDLSDGCKYTNDVIYNWLKTLSKEEKEHFIDSLFSILTASGAKTFKDFANIWQKKLPNMLIEYSKLTKEEKYYLWEVFKSLIAMAIKKIPHAL